MVKSRENFEELIYKNSKTTFRTQSRTCSSVSKLYSESLVVIIKKRRPKDNYYESKGKLKRDLSIATDFCILRNYCKNNRDKFRVKRDTRSNYNETEVFSVKECVGQSCGDSIDDIPKTRINFDLTTLVIENLNNLVGEWVRKHLLDNDETKEKVNSILNTITHRLDVKYNTSSCTYAIDVSVDPNLNDLSAIRNAKNATIKHVSSITSVISLPLNDNHFKIMSTLSVPRHLIRQNTNEIKREKHKKVIELEQKNIIKNKQVTESTVLEKHSSYISSENNKIEDIPNLLTQEQNKDVTVNKTELNRFTYHKENLQFDINSITDFLNLKRVSSLKTDTKLKEPVPNVHTKAMSNKKVNTFQNKHYRRTNYRPKRKRYAVHYNSKQTTMKKGDIMKNMKEFFDCVSFIKEINKVKVDISINVLPIAAKESKDEKHIENKASKGHPYTLDKSLSHNLQEKSQKNKSQQLFFTTKGDILNSTPNLTTLLDSTYSTGKMFGSDNNFIDPGAHFMNKMNRDFARTNGLEIATEIRELKEVVRGLAATAKEMLSTHLTAVGERYKDRYKKTNSEEKGKVTQESTSEGIYQKQNKSVQINSSFSKNVTSYKIDSKKLSRDFPSIYNRVYRKSTSYRLFDSETILRVTDMTSAANSTLVDKYSDTYETSTQKSGSSIDSVANRRKLYAFYCDSLKKDESIRNCMPPYSSGIYYVISQIKDNEIQNISATSNNSESSKASASSNTDIESRPEERKKKCVDCFHTDFQRKFTLSMFFIVPFIIVMSLVYLYLRGQFAFKPSATVFPLLTDKKPINRTALGF